jgi:hypothetical protein
MIPVPPAPEGESKFFCPECNRLLRVPASLAGQSYQCPRCQNWVPVPSAEQAEAANVPTGHKQDNPYGLSEVDQRAYEGMQQPYPSEGGGMSNAAMGWLIFLLIFVVGNIVLYAATGWFIIPIPRR